MTESEQQETMEEQIPGDPVNTPVDSGRGAGAGWRLARVDA
jgi:hypothetical protein